MDEAKWYVVHTYSGYENKVKVNIEKTVENRNLQDLVLEVVVPLETVVEIKNGTQKAADKKMFPGYVLINMVMNDDSWYVVRNTRGVTGFVGPGSKPVPLTPSEIKALGITLSDNKDKNEQKEKPIIHFNGKVGEQVMILSGAWENTVGVIKDINEGKQCLTINVEMFGRETPVEIGFTDVKLM
ncbi:MAG: transcription termination/antitermination factor NusG [Lachnospira sp.]|jgi:transcriptional antiterminator NusG|nr:transcription termination/antitermination factor NusG [Lachnospira sp.]